MAPKSYFLGKRMFISTVTLNSPPSQQLFLQQPYLFTICIHIATNNNLNSLQDNIRGGTREIQRSGRARMLLESLDARSRRDWVVSGSVGCICRVLGIAGRTGHT